MAPQFNRSPQFWSADCKKPSRTFRKYCKCRINIVKCVGSLVNETTFAVVNFKRRYFREVRRINDCNAALVSHKGTRPAHGAGCTSCQSPQQKSSSSKTDRRVLRFYCYTDKYEKEYEKVQTNKQASGRRKDSLLPVPESGDQRRLHSTLCWHNGADGRCRQGSHGGSG